MNAIKYTDVLLLVATSSHRITPHRPKYRSAATIDEMAYATSQHLHRTEHASVAIEADNSGSAVRSLNASKLDRDALSSILAFLSWKEFLSISRMSHEWYAAALYTAVRDESVNCSAGLTIPLIVTYPLYRRHVTILDAVQLSASNPSILQLIADHMTQVRFMAINFGHSYSGEFIFPPKLSTLSVTHESTGGQLSANEWTALTTKICKHIPNLTSLKLAKVVSSEMLRPLLALTHLTEVTLPKIDSVDAFDIIRQLPHIRRLVLQECPTNGFVRFLGDGMLQPISHSLVKLCGLLVVRDDEHRSRLPILPSSLVSTFAAFTPNITRVEYIQWQSAADPWLLLAGWSTKLDDLAFHTNDVGTHNPLRLANALARCSNLTRLSLTCDKLSDAHLRIILSALHRLSSLELWDATALNSLQSLATDATAHLRSTLANLTIYSSRAPPSDVSCLYVLRALRSLTLYQAFRSPLQDAECASFTPHSPSFRSDYFPSLINAYYK